MESHAIEAAQSPLMIEWVPHNIDTTLQQQNVATPKVLSARLLNIEERLMPDEVLGNPWPERTTGNLFFHMVQEVLAWLVNKRLSVVEATVNNFIEFSQAREDVLRRAHVELGTQVNILSSQLLELSKADDEMEWEPSTPVVLPDFERLIEDKVKQAVYHRRRELAPRPPLDPAKKKGHRRSLLEPTVTPAMQRPYRSTSRSTGYASRSPSLAPRDTTAPVTSPGVYSGDGLITPLPLRSAGKEPQTAGAEQRGRSERQEGEASGTGSRRAGQPEVLTGSTQQGPSSQWVIPEEVDPPSQPTRLPRRRAGGAPNPGDESSDDGSEPDRHRHPNQWAHWKERKIRKQIKAEMEAEQFVQLVKAAVARDSGDRDSHSSGKAPDPKPFDGSPEDLERFLSQLSSKFMVERRRYRRDLDKILYASLLLKGDANKWYLSYRLQIDERAAARVRGHHEPLDPSYATWERFEASLRASFGSRLTRELAVEEFEKLRHSDRIDTFLDELIRLTWETGYSDDVVKDKIRRSLNEELSKDWSKVLDKPDSLSGWLVKLREMGHSNEAWAKEHRPRAQASSSKAGKASAGKKGESSRRGGGNQKKSGGPSEEKGKKRDGGWKDRSEELKGIPKSELEFREKHERCLKCGKENHKWFDCWTKDPVVGKAAGAKRKAREEPKRETLEDRPSKKSKSSVASSEAKKEEKATAAGVASGPGRIIELPESDDEEMDIWAE